MSEWLAHVEYHSTPYPIVRVGDTVFPVRAQCELTGKNGAPDAMMRFDIQDGEPTCVSITVTAKQDGRGIETSDLRALRLVQVGADTFSRFGADVAPAGRAVFDGTEDQYWRSKKTLSDSSGQKSKSTNDDLLQEIADDYRANIHGAPVRVIAEKYNLSDRTAARRVEQARARGFLPATTPGKKRG